MSIERYPNEVFMEKEMSEEEMDEIYTDQGKEWIDIPGYSITSFFTRGGIHQLDGEYVEAIQRGNVEPVFLAASIARELHLHRKIKDNLIWNLKSRHLDKSIEIDQQVERVYAKLDRDMLLGKCKCRGFELLQGLRNKLGRAEDIEFLEQAVGVIEETAQRVGAL